MHCLISQKLVFSKLPFDFKERLLHLAPLNDLQNLRKACPGVENVCTARPDYHDQLKITDSADIWQSALKMIFWLRLLRYFKPLLVFYDGLYTIRLIWNSVLHVNEIVGKDRLIYVEDSLILQCKRPKSFKKVIPFIIGPYSRLVINGGIHWKWVKRLITPNVKQVSINGKIYFTQQERLEFLNFVKDFCRGFSYRFSMTFQDFYMEDDLITTFRNHRTHRVHYIDYRTHFVNFYYDLTQQLVLIISTLFITLFFIFFFIFCSFVYRGYCVDLLSGEIIDCFHRQSEL